MVDSNTYIGYTFTTKLSVDKGQTGYITVRAERERDRDRQAGRQTDREF